MRDASNLSERRLMSQEELAEWAIQNLGYKRQSFFSRLFYGSLHGYRPVHYRGGPMTLFPGKGAPVGDEIRQYLGSRDGR